MDDNDRVPIHLHGSIDRVNELISEISMYKYKNDERVQSLGNNLRTDIADTNFGSLGGETYKQLSHWCHPRKWGFPEEWAKPNAELISLLLFGRIVERDMKSCNKVQVRADCPRRRVRELISEFWADSDRWLKTLAKNLRVDLDLSNFKCVCKESHDQLSHWCHPKRWTSREKWAKPRAELLSFLLFGRIIDRE